MKTKSDSGPLLAAYLKLHGESLDPTEVSKILRVYPTKSWEKGDRHTTSAGNEVVRKSGLWGLTADRKLVTIPDMISELIGNISVKESLFQIIPNLEFAEISIFKAEDYSNSGRNSIDISIGSNHLAAIARLGLTISFELCIV